MILNPSNLKKHQNHNPRAMVEVVEKLRSDYEGQRDLILTSLEEARKGKRVTKFFIQQGELGNYDELNTEAKKSVTLIDPFTDQREVGLGFVNELVDLVIKEGEEKLITIH